jgi:3-oxoisoapionate decarboxylase
VSVGLAYTSFAVRMLQGRDIMQTTAAALPAAAFVELCVKAGADGCQIDVSQLEGCDAGALAALRRMLDEHGLFAELSVPAASFLSGEAFAGMAATAHALGVTCVRTALLMGRRYESFPTSDDWRRFRDEWTSRLGSMARMAEGANLVVGIENHKDWLAGELASMLRAVGSSSLGACVDFGNNLSLLEDPVAVVETLAPVAVTTHVKDIAVRAIEDGFEMAEVPLGDGMLPLAHLTETLRRAQPRIRFVLEMITRDPLPVPYRTDRYWTTREASARAAAERLAADWLRSERAALPHTTGLAPEAAIRLEDDHNRACLDYARTSLGL